MTTEREYQQWQSKNKKPPKAPKANFSVILILGFIFISASLSLKTNFTFIHNILSKNIPFSPVSLDAIRHKIFEDDGNTKNKDSITIGSLSDFKHTNFTKIDNYASSIRYEGNSVFELASLLSRSANTKAEKARIIYSWIAYNIAYDLPAYLSGN